jgi:hypothetical protein
MVLRFPALFRRRGIGMKALDCLPNLGYGITVVKENCPC